MRDHLFQPLTWAWVALAWTGVRGLRAGRRREGAACVALAALLTLLGGTPLSSWLLSRLERPYARPAGTFPAPADAVAMLGGGHSASSWETTGVDANASFDRALAAWQLVRRGVSTNLVLGGGVSRTRAGGVHDGDALAAWLRDNGGERASIRVLPDCRTTADEARETAALASRMGWRRIVVVTSAAHLPRALAAFRAAGVEAEGFGSDFRGLDNLEQGRDWSVVPNPGTLWTTQHLLHEVVGRAWYWLRGRG